MSKILSATCENNQVTCEGTIVEGVEILSEGKGQSSGALVLEEGSKKYITSNASDIKQALETMAAAINKIATTLTDIGSGMAGVATAPPPTLAASVAEIQQLKADLETLKGALK